MRNSWLVCAVFSQENKGVERIRDYRCGHVVIDGEAHARDAIVLPSRVVANWWRKEGHSLVPDDVIDELPGTLIVGCGASSQMRPDPKTPPMPFGTAGSKSRCCRHPRPSGDLPSVTLSRRPPRFTSRAEHPADGLAS